MPQKKPRKKVFDFNHILDAMPDSLIIVDSQGEIQLANTKAEEMFGYTAKELLGKSIELLIPERFGRHRELREVYQKFQRKRPMDTNYILVALRKDRTEFHVEISLNPFETRGETYTIAAIRDVSQHKRTEAELEKSLLRYRHLLDGMLEGCQIIDFDWRYIYINDIAARQGGHKPDEFLMHTMTDLYPGIENTQLFEILTKCMKERVPLVFENQFRFPDGATGWFDMRVEPVPEGIFILSNDITERRQAEEVLKRNEKRYHSLFVDSPVSLWEEDFSEIKRRVEILRQQGVIDFKSYFASHPEVVMEWSRLVRVVDVNQSAVKLYQAGSKEDLLSNLESVLARNITEHFQDELLAIAQGKSHYSREGTELTLTGERIDVQISWSVAPNFEDDLSRVIVAIVDISELKQAEGVIKARTEALQTLYELSRALAETDDLETILNLVSYHAVEIVHNTFSRVALLEGDTFVIRAAHPIRVLDHDLQVGKHVPLDALPICLRVLEQSEPVVIQASDPQIGDEERKMLMFDFIKSTCVIPLQVGDSSQNQKNRLGLLMLAEARDEDREPFDWYKIRLAQSVGDQATTAIRRALLHEQTRHQLQSFRALSDIDRVITSTVDLNTSIRLVLPHVMEQLGVDAVSVLLFNQAAGTLSYLQGLGFRTDAFKQTRELQLRESIVGRTILEHRMIHVPDLATLREEYPHLARANANEGFVSYFGVPLIAKARILGVLQIFHRSLLKVNEDWLEFLQTLAGQTAIAVDNAELFTNLERTNTELALAYETTLEGWSAALDLRDKETEGHTQRVTAMTLELAREMGMTNLELMNVRRGALLHDIGKMGVPDHILLKPDKLTDEEWVQMQKHPVYAYEMLSHIAYLRDALDIPYCHHEKWDGTGYPRGLKGDAIPLAARIFAVVDIYDALTSDRPYRSGWSKERAIEYIREQSGSHLEPEVVQAFIKMIKRPG